MDLQNDLAFGKVSENSTANVDFSFADNFSPPSDNVNTQSDVTDQCESWRADGYLQSLETKLQRLKGKTSTGQQSKRTLTSRDILKTLDQARHDSARHLISSDYVHDFGDDVYSAAGDTQVPALKRRMFPEQAMSPEELQELIRKDYLQAATREAAEEASEEETSGSR